MSIVDCSQSANLSKELVDPNEGACVSACDVSDLFGGTLHHHQHCSLKALDLEVFLLMRGVLMLFVFPVSISFCKNARFLAVPFSMIEIACWNVSMTSTNSASDSSPFWFSLSLLIPSETCLLISLNRIFTLSNDSLHVTSSNFVWECAPGS